MYRACRLQRRCRGGAEAVQRRSGGVRRGAELQLGVIVAAAEAAAARLRCPCPPPGQGGWSVVSGQGQGQGQWSGVAGGSKPLRVSNGVSGAWLPPASSASPRPLPRTWSSTATWSRQAARAPNGTRRRGPAKVGLGFRIGGMGLGVVAVGVKEGYGESGLKPPALTPTPVPIPSLVPFPAFGLALALALLFTTSHSPTNPETNPTPARALALT